MADDKQYPLPINQCQLFPHSYKITCETYSCRKASTYFMGRPDGPLAVMRNFCPDCVDSVIESILATPELVEKHIGRIKEIAAEHGMIEGSSIESQFASIKDGEKLNSFLSQPKVPIQRIMPTAEDGLPAEPKKYQCSQCDAEPFDSPQKLGAHVKKEHPKAKE